jgi:demethylmenaquinone methyltransferase/2-methoxy-6-polyprenyl-1,4-benzoquinol methylase
MALYSAEEKVVTKKVISNDNKKSPSRKEVWLMFDRIAHRYDLLNRLLSFGQDVVWRNRLARHLNDNPDQKILDLATGTGDVLLSLQKKSHVLKEGIGIDMSEKMLEIGRKKIIERKLQNILTLIVGNANDIPFPENSFDVVTIAFGIRNVDDTDKALCEMYRVLKNDGRLIILEFSLPANRFIRNLYLFYFRNILPKIGGIISGDSYAYNYLNETVETFPYGEQFGKLLVSNGFQNVNVKTLTFGIASIYRGDKIN